MTTHRPAGPPASTAAAPPRPMLRGPMGGANFGPPQKARTFKASARRLRGRLAPERRLIKLVIALALVSVVLAVSGPRLLGHATDIVFAGYFGSRLPAGIAPDPCHERGLDAGVVVVAEPAIVGRRD